MMEGQLIFCSDSILRFRSDYDETTALPLLSIQKAISDIDLFSARVELVRRDLPG